MRQVRCCLRGRPKAHLLLVQDRTPARMDEGNKIEEDDENGECLHAVKLGDS